MMLRRLILHELKGGEELYLFKILTLTNEGGWARVERVGGAAGGGSDS